MLQYMRDEVFLLVEWKGCRRERWGMREGFESAQYVGSNAFVSSEWWLWNAGEAAAAAIPFWRSDASKSLGSRSSIVGLAGALAIGVPLTLGGVDTAGVVGIELAPGNKPEPGAIVHVPLFRWYFNPFGFR